MRKPLTVEFRLLFVAILLVIVPFGLLLYLLPSQTATYWAWTIPNPRSAILIGAGYLGMALYYLVALWQNDRRQITAGFGGLVVFTIIVIIATLTHWAIFRLDRIATIAWLVLLLAPLPMLPGVWRWLLGRDKSPQSGESIDDFWCRWLTGRATVYSVLAVLGLLFAEAISARWPWTAGPMEIRVFMAQVALVGWSGFIAMRGDSLWRTHRLSLLLIGIIGALQLIGLVIGPGVYEWGAPFGLILLLMFVEWVLTPLIIFITHRTLGIE